MTNGMIMLLGAHGEVIDEVEGRQLGNSRGGSFLGHLYDKDLSRAKRGFAFTS